MAKYVYPAVFTPEESGYSILFPNLDGCYTQGNDLTDGMEMAKDVLCLTLYGLEEDGKEIPAPSAVNDVPHKENEFVTLVSCDTIEYRRFFDNRAVKKTLTIPSWLNDMAERNEINFSGVLQEALKAKLNVWLPLMAASFGSLLNRTEDEDKMRERIDREYTGAVHNLAEDAVVLATEDGTPLEIYWARNWSRRKEYAERNGRSPASARHMAERSWFQTADSSTPMLFLALMLAAGAALVVLFGRRRVNRARAGRGRTADKPNMT